MASNLPIGDGFLKEQAVNKTVPTGCISDKMLPCRRILKETRERRRQNLVISKPVAIVANFVDSWKALETTSQMQEDD